MVVIRKILHISLSIIAFLHILINALLAAETTSEPVVPAQYAINRLTEATNAARQNLQIEHVRQILATTKDFSGKNLSYLELTQFDFSGANLTDANLVSTELYGANFSNANLTRANLRSSSLEKTNFSGANMREVQLNDSRLFGANFEGADLEHAKMRRCYADKVNLRRSNLRCADLSWGFFAGAKYEGSNLDGAIIEGTIFEQDKERLQSINTGPDICVQISATKKTEREQAAAIAAAEESRLVAVKLQAQKAEQERLAKEKAEKNKAEQAIIVTDKFEREPIVAASAKVAPLADARQEQEHLEKTAAEGKKGQQEAVITQTEDASKQSTELSKQNEQQIIENKLLVLQDPTVSHPKKWSAGGNFEYWYVSQDYKTNVGASASSGTIDAFKPGYSVFVGYDDFTLQLSYKYGKFSADNTIPNSNYNYTKTIKESEFELALRYVFHKSRWLNPYLIVGYNNLYRKITTALNTDQAVRTTSGGDTINVNSTHNSLLTGIGSIIPLNESLGLRMDYRLLLDYYQAEGPKNNERYEAIGLPMRLTLTGYWNIYKGLNLQLGTRYDYFPEIVNYGSSRERLGTFTSFGYTYKF